MTLPPEILDEILEHIPTDIEGRQRLVACALVATRWTRPSQRRLFSSVSINHGNYQRWINSVASSGSKSHPLEYVCLLKHHFIEPIEISYWMRNLHNVHSLAFFGIVIKRIGEGEVHTCFSAFRETLTYLTLRRVSDSARLLPQPHHPSTGLVCSETRRGASQRCLDHIWEGYTLIAVAAIARSFSTDWPSWTRSMRNRCLNASSTWKQSSWKAFFSQVQVPSIVGG